VVETKVVVEWGVPIWDILTAIGTIGATFAAVFIAVSQGRRERKEGQRRLLVVETELMSVLTPLLVETHDRSKPIDGGKINPLLNGFLSQLRLLYPGLSLAGSRTSNGVWSLITLMSLYAGDAGWTDKTISQIYDMTRRTMEIMSSKGQEKKKRTRSGKNKRSVDS
jgi:hypothetical protein